MAPATIRTPDQRVRVFVSSTLGELATERLAVRAAIEQLRLIPVLFELGARPHPPRELYRAYLQQSHVFLGLYWERYGWVAPGETISGLEDEFRLSTGMPRLIYVKDPAPAREPRLTEMLEELQQGGDASYRHFRDADELRRLVLDDLAVLLTERFESTTAPAARPAAPAVDDTRPTIHPARPPVPLTPVVGREADIVEVVELLRGGVRLLTLSGPGGIGKSRLALEVVRRLAGVFADGIAFVPLEAVGDPDQVVRTIAERLGIRDSGGRPLADVLADALQGRRLLLLLDNFEQVIPAAPALGALLDRCPDLHALVTSRQVLRLRAEHERPVAPLALPSQGDADDVVDQAAAVDLFVQRAAAARPDFALTDQNREVVAELCRRLDGLPLAIELAAARLRLLPPDALLARLGHRLDLLTGGAADLPERQRTLRGTLDWSYGLLDPHERTLLRRLSVFGGGATIDAVEAVCGDEAVPDVLGTLSSLLEKSLLVSADLDGGLPRLRLLRVVREYAAGHLSEEADEEATVRDRHARWYTAFSEAADPFLHEDGQTHWPALEADVSNLRIAAAWALEQHRLDVAVDLLFHIWTWAWLSGRLGELRQAMELLLDLLPADTDRVDRLRVLYVAANARFMTGDLQGAAELFSLARTMLRPDDPPQIVGPLRMTTATVLVGLDRIDEAETDAVAALGLAEQIGNGWLTGYANSICGSLRLLRGDLDGARILHERALEVATRIELDVMVGQAHGQLALIELLTGQLTAARTRLTLQVETLRRSGNLEGLGYALDGAATLAVAEQRWEDAATALAAAEAVRERIGLPIWPLMRPYHDTSLATARTHLGDRAADVIAAGRSRDPWAVADEVIAGTVVRIPNTSTRPPGSVGVLSPRVRQNPDGT